MKCEALSGGSVSLIGLCLIIKFNTLRPRQNRQNNADEILNAFYCMKLLGFGWQFHGRLLLRIQLKIESTLVLLLAWGCTGVSHYITSDDPGNQQIYASLCQWVKALTMMTEKFVFMIFEFEIQLYIAVAFVSKTKRHGDGCMPLSRLCSLFIQN